MFITRKPELSVVMPVYNAERYLSKAVESILAQTFKNFEFLIIDDGSTDSSISILQQYAQGDSRVQLIRLAHSGIVNALNRGLAEAQGEFIARMDADDIALPQRLQVQVDYLRQKQDCIGVGCQIELIDPQGQMIGSKHLPLSHNDIDQALLKGHGDYICHPSFTVRRAAMVTLQGYSTDCEYAEDLDLFLRLAEQGELINLPDILLHYRQHLESICYTQTKQQRSIVRHCIQTALKRRGLQASLMAEVVLPEPRNRPEVYQDWARRALKNGHLRTAAGYTCRSLLYRPWSWQSWKLLREISSWKVPVDAKA